MNYKLTVKIRIEKIKKALGESVILPRIILALIGIGMLFIGSVTLLIFTQNGESLSGWFYFILFALVSIFLLTLSFRKKSGVGEKKLGKLQLRILSIFFGIGFIAIAFIAAAFAQKECGPTMAWSLGGLWVAAGIAVLVVPIIRSRGDETK